MYSTPNSPTIKHCAQCGAEFEAHSARRLYCAVCIDRRYHPVIKRQCSICGADVEVILRSHKATTEKSKRTICVACREAALVRKCRDCGVALVKPGVQRCAACWKKNRTAQRKKHNKPAAKSGVCEHCGGPCGKQAKYCKACSNTKNGVRKELQPTQCKICGETYSPKYRNQQCCGKDCQIQASILANKAKTDQINVFTCKRCGKIYKAKDKDRKTFCGRECASAYYTEHGRPERRKPKPEPKPMPPCAVCGEPCKRRDVKTCSLECREERERRKSQQYWADRSNRDRRPRRCKECGQVFTPEYGDKRQKYCGKECMRKQTKRIGKATRKARIRNAPVVEAIDPIAVFRRDGWRCKLCGCKTPKRLRGTTDDSAPELDHVVPLAMGGAHSYANTQCACRKCNQAKGATIAGQTALL